MKTSLVLVLSLLAAVVPQEEKKDEKKIEPLRLEIEVATKIAKESLKEKGIPVEIKLSNQGKDEIRVTPYLSFDILDKDGKSVKASRRLGRWGFSRGCNLEGLKIETIAAGKSLERSADALKFMLDPHYILEWKLEPGKYRLAFSYAGDPDWFQGRCKCKKVDHDDPKQPWNKVSKLKAEASAEIVIE